MSTSEEGMQMETQTESHEITMIDLKKEIEMKAGSVHPVIILPPGAMSPADMERLRGNGFCVVEAEKPELVKFLDPIPAVADRTAIENAAIQLSRKVMSPGFWENSDTRQLVIENYFDILIHGTPLDPKPSQREREERIFDEAKSDELRRLAREEAKADRAAAKALKEKQSAAGKEKKA